jgi:hypothetical protein
MGTPYIPPTFKPPTPEELAANPSYQFRLRGGQQAIDRSAAARGMLRTGGTLKDLAEYGQNFASQEYENAYDRALREYDLQRQNALDKWKSDWEQYVFAATPRGGGGGRREDIPPPPPEAPPGGPPGEEEPTVPTGPRNPKYPGWDPNQY